MNMQQSTFEQFTQDRENLRVYEQERLLVDATELVSRVMEVTDTKRAELAKRLGRSKALITQILRGSQNLTLKTLSEVFFAMNYRPVIAAEPFDGTGYLFVREWNICQHSPSVVSAEDIDVEDECYGGVAA